MAGKRLKPERSGVRILPVLMIFAALCFGVRFSEMIKNIAAAGSIAAYAASPDARLNNIMTAAGETAAPPDSQLKGVTDPPAKPPAPTMEKPAPAAGTISPVAKPGDKTEVSAKTETDAGSPPKKAGWKGAEDVEDDYADVKMEMFADLSKRRKDLEAKEKELNMREALLKAAQAEIQQKTDELTNIKTDIQSLLKQQTEQEDKRITSLVKIYEGMKPKDAARIFNTLDMDVLLEVVTKMSERKTGPILASMDADKARNLTTMLAEQNKLPDLPTLPTGQ